MELGRMSAFEYILSGTWYKMLVKQKWTKRDLSLQSESWYLAYFSGGRFEGKIFPAPPWIMSRGVIDGEGLLYSILLELSKVELRSRV